ncbi:MAG: PLP-dependent aminotransferase family protein [Acidimicrobiales bacterium]
MVDRLGSNALLNMLGDWRADGYGALHSQLAVAVARSVESGVLAAGTVLPSERTLARSLDVSRSTVTAALNELRSAGVLESRQGSGTRVAGGPQGRGVAERPGATVLPGLLGPRGVDDQIDLAASTPDDAGALPRIDIDADALLDAGSGHGYTPAGLPALRDAVAQRLTLGGLPTVAEEVLITNGAQHGLALALDRVAPAGGRVIVDEPTYPGVIDLLRSRSVRGLPLARTAGGIDATGLRRLVRAQGTTAAYLQTSVHNPTGWAAQDWQFRELAKACDDLGLTVIEDLVLADLRYDGSLPAPIAARTRKATVIVIGSISKLGWGGLRIGWLRGPADVVERLVRTRLADDLGSSVPSQLIAAGVLEHFDDVAGIRQRTLGERAELARTLIADRLPTWRPAVPAGGLSLWIQLPEPLAEPLAQRARRHGVLVATGVSASIEGRFDDHVRICFDRAPDRLEAGIDRLAAAWDELVGA